MFVKINSVGMFGMNSYEVGVEASIDNALPRFDMVGLPDTAVSESRDRVRSAIKNNGFFFPIGRKYDILTLTYLIAHNRIKEVSFL